MFEGARRIDPMYVRPIGPTIETVAANSNDGRKMRICGDV
jgi:hypothetical protein